MNYKKTLESYLEQDSIRHLLIGFWKLDTLKTRMDKNCLGCDEYNSFTMNIDESGYMSEYVNNRFNQVY